jgi:hypothetical protein
VVTLSPQAVVAFELFRAARRRILMVSHHFRVIISFGGFPLLLRFASPSLHLLLFLPRISEIRRRLKQSLQNIQYFQGTGRPSGLSNLPRGVGPHDGAVARPLVFPAAPAGSKWHYDE